MTVRPGVLALLETKPDKALSWAPSSRALQAHLLRSARRIWRSSRKPDRDLLEEALTRAGRSTCQPGRLRAASEAPTHAPMATCRRATFVTGSRQSGRKTPVVG
jgi:hypothetical protein